MNPIIDDSARVRIRAATPDDATAISKLILELAHLFLEDPSRPETGARFFSLVSPEAIRSYIEDARFRYQVAEGDGDIVATVAVRDGTHLYHLFVSESYQGKGLGRRLWHFAQAAASNASGRFTVNASLNAVRFYEKEGFAAAADPVRQDGLAFLPMIKSGVGHSSPAGEPSA